MSAHTMERRLISSGSPFEPIVGFSRAVRVGPYLAVAGTAPVAPGGGVAAPGDMYGQTRRCLEIISQAVKEAGLTLDTFHRHADKVAMANVAQLVNCLQSLFFAHEDKFCVTPTYHVFDMYSPHQGAQSVRAVFSAPVASYTRNGKPASVAGLSGSASLNGKRLIVTVTNPSMDTPRETEIVLRGAKPGTVKVTTLAAGTPSAHNSFTQPKSVAPAESTAMVRNDGTVTYRFAPASVTRLDIALA